MRRIVFYVITDQDYPWQHINQWPRKTRERTTTLATKKKKAYVRIKRVKSNSYLFHGKSCKTLNYTCCTFQKHYKCPVGHTVRSKRNKIMSYFYEKNWNWNLKNCINIWKFHIQMYIKLILEPLKLHCYPKIS